MFGLPPVLTMCAVLFAGLLSLAFIWDMDAYRIPNRISLALVALFPVYVTASPLPVDWTWSIVIMLATLGVGLIAFGTGLCGGGDVKLLAATTLWAGPEAAMNFLLLTCILGGVLSFVLMSPNRWNLALLCDHVGSQRLSALLISDVIPYGVAIASAGILVIVPKILSIPLV